MVLVNMLLPPCYFLGTLVLVVASCRLQRWDCLIIYPTHPSSNIFLLDFASTTLVSIWRKKMLIDGLRVWSRNQTEKRMKMEGCSWTGMEL